MNGLDLQTRCQALLAGDDDIERALHTLDERLAEWLGALGRLNASAFPAGAQEREAPTATTVQSPAPTGSGTSTAPEEDEEALLAALDPDTAAAVRVKRRLLGNRRSLRELIAEVEASRGGKREKPQGRSWWR